MSQVGRGLYEHPCTRSRSSTPTPTTATMDSFPMALATQDRYSQRAPCLGPMLVVCLLLPVLELI